MDPYQFVQIGVLFYIFSGILWNFWEFLKDLFLNPCPEIIPIFPGDIVSSLFK